VRQRLSVQDMCVETLRSQLKDSLSDELSYKVGWYLGKGLRDEIWIKIGIILCEELQGR